MSTNRKLWHPWQDDETPAKRPRNSEPAKPNPKPEIRPKPHPIPLLHPLAALNPIVAAVLSGQGAGSLASNRCAVCAITFRLTSDLVQHMRSRHSTMRARQSAEQFGEDSDSD